MIKSPVNYNSLMVGTNKSRKLLLAPPTLDFGLWDSDQ